MKCVTCGKAEYVHDTRDMSYTYKGRKTVIPGIIADHCPACGGALFALDEGDDYMKAIGAFHKEVNAELADANFVASVRKKLGLTQKEAGALFGGGHNAFSRYENGRAVPPVGLLILFKILERHPELLKEITDNKITDIKEVEHA